MEVDFMAVSGGNSTITSGVVRILRSETGIDNKDILIVRILSIRV